MFYVIKDNLLVEYGDKITYAWLYANEAKELKDVTVNDYFKDTSKYLIQDNEIVLNPNYEQEQTEERENNFKKEFFYITGYGWYRKTPKGYSSAVESIMALGMFYSTTGVPEGILTFYEAPDFSQENQCNEEWLVENSYKNSPMTAEELQEFITKFMMSWNTEEHQ